MYSIKFIKSGEWSHRGHLILKEGKKKWIVCKKTSGVIPQVSFQGRNEWLRLKDAQHAINDYLNSQEQQ